MNFYELFQQKINEKKISLTREIKEVQINYFNDTFKNILVNDDYYIDINIDSELYRFKLIKKED